MSKSKSGSKLGYGHGTGIPGGRGKAAVDGAAVDKTSVDEAGERAGRSVAAGEEV